MHHHDIQPVTTRRHRRLLRIGLLTLAVAGAAGMVAAAPAQASPVDEPGDPLTLLPDPWDECVVSYEGELPDPGTCPPDIGDEPFPGVVVICNDVVCVVHSGGSPVESGDHDDPDEILCPPGLPGSDDPFLGEGDPDQPCGGGDAPFDEPEGPFLG
jgi:hypothetical protein